MFLSRSGLNGCSRLYHLYHSLGRRQSVLALSRYKPSSRLSSSILHRNYQLRRKLSGSVSAASNDNSSQNEEETPFAPPHVEGEEKTYPKKIQDIVTEISRLTLLEVADLNELLKKTLRIDDAPMMAMATAPAQPDADKDAASAQPAKESKILFGLKLTNFKQESKVALIKEIKANVEDLNLVQAKKFVEGVPQVVKTELTKDEVEELKTKLEAAGGTCEIT